MRSRDVLWDNHRNLTGIMDDHVLILQGFFDAYKYIHVLLYLTVFTDGRPLSRLYLVQ